jgi:transcriptional regulator with XRE-family HTH domain
MVFTPRFKECRLAAGVTQQQAAAQLGRTPSAIQKWERGKNSPTMEDIRRLADAYHIEPVDFFKTDNLLMLTADEHQRVVIDANVFVSLGPHARDRLLSQLKACIEALITVPEEFADYWIAGLKACASIVLHEMKHSPPRQRQSSKAIEPTIQRADDAKPPARRRSESRVPIVRVGRIPMSKTESG